MKIVYCILGTYNSGGMERVLANKANYLAERGYEIIVVTTDQQSRASYFRFHSAIQEVDLGINYTDDQGKAVLRKVVSYALKQRQHRKRLEELLQQLKADIVISMFDHDASFITKIADGSKKVLEIHFSRYKRLQYNRSGLLGYIDSWRSKQDLQIVQRFDRFVVLTAEDQCYWGPLDNIQVIPNANSFVAEGQSTLEAKQVIAVGRYDYQKGFSDLIRIWSKLASRYSDWRLVIYGHGPLQASFEAQITALGLGDSIELRAAVQDIEAAYLASSVMVMTSRYEGLPMVLLEAQSCGLPLVSYACKCGPKDIIQDGVNGYLVAEGDQVGFAAQLELLLGDEIKRKSFGAASLALSANFSTDHIMPQWITLFRDLQQ